MAFRIMKKLQKLKIPIISFFRWLINKNSTLTKDNKKKYTQTAARSRRIQGKREEIRQENEEQEARTHRTMPSFSEKKRARPRRRSKRDTGGKRGAHEPS